MDNRFDHPDAIQCVECGRFRTDGTWKVRETIRGEVVSHTICGDCQPMMLDDLRWEMEFPAWPVQKQLEAIRLRVRHVPMDPPAVLEKLQSMGVREHDILVHFMEQLRPFLVDRLCPYCRAPIEADAPTANRAGYVLHTACARHLTDSMTILTTLAPSENHLDAYMDVARIPHGVREGVRKGIEKV